MSATFEHNNEEEKDSEEEESEKSNNVVKIPATLACVESLSFPAVQEVVILADYRCKRCRDRVANVVSRLNGGDMESMEMMIMDNKVTLTFTTRDSKAIKTHGNKLAVYKNIRRRISNILRYPNAK